MASNVVDIIQRLLLTGDREVTASFNRIAAAGSAAFSAIGQAAGKVSQPFSKFEADLDKVEKKANTFGRSIANAAGSIGTLATRAATATAGLGAAGALMGRGLLNISTQIKSVSASLIEQRLAASQATGEAKKAAATDFSHANAVEDLALQYRKGKIGINEYTEQLRELNRVNDRTVEQQRIQEMQAERLREEQAKAMADAQKRAIQIKLEASYGGALASQFINLANVLDTVRQRFFGAFGPQIASAMQAVVQAISDAAPQIFATFEKISAAIQQAFAGSGITVKDVVAGLVKLFGDVSLVVINVLVPAFKVFMDVLGVIADVINKIFGTNFSATTLVAIAIVLKLAGVFGALVSVVQLAAAAFGLLRAAAGPWGLLITALIVGLTLLAPLLAKIDWAGWAKTAQDAWNKIKKGVGEVADLIKAAWGGVVKFFDDAIKSIIGFFDNLIKKVKQFLGLTGDTGGGKLAGDLGINDIGKFAGGGLFHGRRKGRDTNLAWLTDKEYIVNPKATKYWGVNFLNAINRMATPIRGFAEGGLNSLSSPSPRVAFAGGSSGRATANPMTLIIGDQEFGGLTVEDNTADRMARFAQRRGVRSTGRRPLWFGGGK